MTPVRVLELRSVRGTGGGPEKTILLGAAYSDPEKFAVTVCYIRDARDSVFAIDKRAAGMPIDYVEVVERHSFDWSIVPALRRIVRDRRIDIVHAHDYKTDVLAWLLRRTEAIIPMSTAHGWAGHTPRERLFYHPLDKFILRAFPKVIAVSDDIRAELIRWGVDASRTQTILNGIEHMRFKRDRSREREIRRGLGFNDADVVVASVGRLEREKRYDLLIDAVALLRPRWPGIKLVLVGAGTLRGALDAQIERLGLRHCCQLLGERSDVIDLHHAFDLFVQSSSNEGAPNAVLEAMALETPVVATAVGGTPQLCRDGIDGILVAPGSAAALADAMSRALGDREAAAARATTARHRIETTLSFAARMDALEAVYAELFRAHHVTDSAVLLART